MGRNGSKLTLETLQVNGTGRMTAKGPTARQRGVAAAARKAERWSHRYTAGAIVLSSGLNAWSSAVGETGWHQGAGALLGASIPLLVWCLSKCCGWTYKAGWKRLAMVSGAVGCCLLALSVVHVSCALADLTGTAMLLAVLFAVGIDAGLVATEATAILVSVQE